MRTMRAILGYGWALLGLPLVLTTFMGMNYWSAHLARATGVTVSPRFTGGPVARTLPHPGYETRIHQPVFAGLLGERARGFVQLDWVPSAIAKELPAAITEEIDYDADGQPDFRVQLTTRTYEATVTPLASGVLGLDHVFRLETNRSLRVSLSRPPR